MFTQVKNRRFRNDRCGDFAEGRRKLPVETPERL